MSDKITEVTICWILGSIAILALLLIIEYVPLILYGIAILVVPFVVGLFITQTLNLLFH